MTVGELIDRLRTFDPLLKAVMPSDNEDWREVDGAYIDNLATRGLRYAYDRRGRDCPGEGQRPTKLL